MGLNIVIDPEEDDNSFLVYECTGKFANDNLGGFGGINFRVNQIVKSLLYIWGPSDTGYNSAIDVTGSLPNSDDIPYQVFPSQIGQSDSIESGQYKLKIEHTFQPVAGASVTNTGYATVVFTKNIVCCIDALGPIDSSKDAFKDPRQKHLLKLHNLIESVAYQCEKGLYDAANKTIDYLKSQCKCSGCK